MSTILYTGRIFHSFCMARRSLTEIPLSLEIVLSRNSYSFALRSNSSSIGPTAIFFSISMMSWNFCRNQMSIFVIPCIFSFVTPRRSDSATTQSRRSSTTCRRLSSSSSERSFSVSSRRLYVFCSRQRIAFISAASKFGAMPITSPVAFICVPSIRLACINLSNGQRGIFTTQ